MKKTSKFKVLVTSALAVAMGLGLGINVSAADTDLTEATDATISFNAGELSLFSAPDLNFGTHMLSEVETFSPVNTPADVSVADFRGSGAGWKLTAQLSTFTLQSNLSTTLQGAKITMSDPSVSKINVNNTSAAPTAPSSIEMIAGGASVAIMTAAAGTGTGAWTQAWSTSNTLLTIVPGNAREGVSKAVMNWTLAVAP